MFCGGRPLGEPPGALEHHIHAEVFPWEACRISLVQHPDPFRAGPDGISADLDRVGCPPVDRVVLHQVSKLVCRVWIVHRNDLDILWRVDHVVVENFPPDPPKPIDGNLLHQTSPCEAGPPPLWVEYMILPPTHGSRGGGYLGPACRATPRAAAATSCGSPR